MSLSLKGEGRRPRASSLVSTLGLPPTLLERDGILGVVCATSTVLGWHTKEGMVLGEIVDALLKEVTVCIDRGGSLGEVGRATLTKSLRKWTCEPP